MEVKKGRPPKEGHKLRGSVHCCYGKCTSDSRPKYAKGDVGFLPFPKPCLLYRRGEIQNKLSHIKNCKACNTCNRWVQLCRRTDGKFSTIDNVTRCTYICTLHFIDGVPSEHNPDPTIANATMLEAARRKKRAPPKQRLNIFKQEAKSPEEQMNYQITNPSENQTNSEIAKPVERQMNLQITKSPEKQTNSETAKPAEQNQQMDFEIAKSSGLSVTTNAIENQFPSIQDLASYLMHCNWFVSIPNDKELRLITTADSKSPLQLDFAADKHCSVKVFGKTIPNNHSFWTQNTQPTTLDEISNLAHAISDKWKPCEGMTHAEEIEAFKKVTNSKKGYLCPISNAVRSTNCDLLSALKLCLHCKAYKKSLAVKIRRSKQPVRTHPCTNLRYKTRDELLASLHLSNKLLHTATLKLKFLQDKVDKLISNGSTVNGDFNADLVTISNGFLQHLADDSFAKIFLQEQLRVAQRKNTQGYKWHPEIIKWCLYLRAKSHTVYEFLQDSGSLRLPSKRLLHNYGYVSKMPSGFNDDRMNFLKSRRAKDGACHAGYFALVHDEVKILDDLVYDRNSGEIIGFVQLKDAYSSVADLVSTEETVGMPAASHVLQFVVNGLTTDFSEVYAYFPCERLDADKLHFLVWEAVGRLEEHGFKILMNVCDGVDVNRSMIKKNARDVCSFKSENKYATDERRDVHFVLDPPYLLKTIRDCFSNSNFHSKNRKLWNGKDISWLHVLKLHEMDVGSSPRLAPKLTRAHVFLDPISRMKVKYAAQVMSNTTAVAMEKLVGEEASETVRFIRLVNRFFDMLNTRRFGDGHPNDNPDLEAYNDPNDSRLQWLENDFLEYFASWRRKIEEEFPGISAGEKAKMQLSCETLEGIEITVRSICACVRFLLLKGADFVFTSRMMQDKLEQNFGCNSKQLTQIYGHAVSSKGS